MWSLRLKAFPHPGKGHGNGFYNETGFTQTIPPLYVFVNDEHTLPSFET